MIRLDNQNSMMTREFYNTHKTEKKLLLALLIKILFSQQTLYRIFPNKTTGCLRPKKKNKKKKKKKKKNQSFINKFYTQCLCGFATILRKKNCLHLGGEGSDGK